MILEIRSSDSVVYEEFPLYPLNLLISDIGGIAGLVMGINLIHIISMRASTDYGRFFHVKIHAQTVSPWKDFG